MWKGRCACSPTRFDRGLFRRTGNSEIQNGSNQSRCIGLVGSTISKSESRWVFANQIRPGGQTQCIASRLRIHAAGFGSLPAFEEGFKEAGELQRLRDQLGEGSYFLLDSEEMVELRSNLFSIRRDTVVSDLRFARVNEWLRSKGYRVHELDLSPVGALGGLFRCTTLPLYRKNGSNG